MTHRPERIRRIRATAGLAVACAVVAAAGAFFAAASSTAVYESSAEVSDYLALRKGDQLGAKLFSLEVVARLTAETVDPPLGSADVSRRVTVSGATRDGRRTITAAAAQPSAARDLAAVYVEQYVSHRTGSLNAEVRDRRRALRSQLRRLDGAEDRARLREEIVLLRRNQRSAPQPSIARQASLPDSPARPKPWRNALIALVAGALLAILFRRLTLRLGDTGDANTVGAAPR